MMAGGTVTLMFALSVDGFLTDADGGTEWQAPFPLWDDDLLAAFDVVVLGRATYDRLSHRLSQTDAPWPYRGKQVEVLTRRPLGEALFPGVRPTADLAQTVQAARAQGRAVWLAGGASVVEQSLAAGVVDELDLYTIPLALGAGVRAWPTTKRRCVFPLLMVEALPGGVIHSRYRVDERQSDKEETIIA